MRLRIAFISLIIFAASLSSCAYAYLDQTAAGIVITAEGTECPIIYQDTGGVTADASYAATIETVVDDTYGFDYLTDLLDWNYTTPTRPVTYTYTLTNEGNTSVDSAYWGAYIVPGGAAGFDGYHWKVLITAEGSAYSIMYFDGTQHITSPPFNWGNSQDSHLLDKGEMRKIYLTVTPSTLESESPDGAYLMVTLEGMTMNTPAGFYDGANGNTYAGTPDVTDMTITCIHVPVMKITRTSTVDAPVPGGYTGDAHDAVPGSVISYTMLISNEGSTAAKDVIIIDKVPAHTEAAYLGDTATMPVPGPTKVNVTAPDQTATDWIWYFTIDTDPPKNYGAGNGTTWTAPGSSTQFATNNQVTYVKWEKATVEATEDGKTLRWGVMIY